MTEWRYMTIECIWRIGKWFDVLKQVSGDSGDNIETLRLVNLYFDENFSGYRDL